VENFVDDKDCLENCAVSAAWQGRFGAMAAFLRLCF